MFNILQAQVFKEDNEYTRTTRVKISDELENNSSILKILRQTNDVHIALSKQAGGKAMFTYLGIEHLDIKHSETSDGSTHFWSMVNIGTSESPMWYYYDATRLSRPFESGSGCLFTEAQLDNYNTVIKPGFYDFDHAGYPNTAAKVINKDYKW